MEGHLSQDEFFARLADLFSQYQDRDHGSVYLVQKRLTYDQPPLSAPPANPDPLEPSEAFPDLSPPQSLPLIIRATNGHSKPRREKRRSKIKLSTIVQPDDLDAFYARYAEVCKAGMVNLKPRDRSKRKKKEKKRKKAAAVSAGASAATS